ARLFLKLDLDGQLRFTPAGRLKGVAFESDLLLGARLPGSDQIFPLVMKSLPRLEKDIAGPDTVANLVSFVEVQNFGLPLRNLTFDVPVPTVTPKTGNHDGVQET